MATIGQISSASPMSFNPRLAIAAGGDSVTMKITDVTDENNTFENTWAAGEDSAKFFSAGLGAEFIEGGDPINNDTGQWDVAQNIINGEFNFGAGAPILIQQFMTGIPIGASVQVTVEVRVLYGGSATVSINSSTGLKEAFTINQAQTYTAVVDDIGSNPDFRLGGGLSVIISRISVKQIFLTSAGTYDVEIDNPTLIEQFDSPSNSWSGTFNSELMTELSYLDISDASIDSISILPLINMETFNCNDNSFSQELVDNTLAELVVNESNRPSGLPTCTVDISGDNSAPSDSGLENAFTLIYLADWSVTVTISEDNFILISTQEEIQAINTDLQTLSWNYRLISDVKAELPWTPIGETIQSPFNGIFDGGGHTIDSISIVGFSSGNVGVFGSATGQIKNLGITNINIDSSGSVVGGIVGNGFSGVSVSQCYVTGSIKGIATVAGIAGQLNGGNVSDCYTQASIEAGGSRTAGAFGFFVNNSIVRCYSTGTVDALATTYGFIGEKLAGFTSDCFWDVEASLEGNPGDNNYGAIGKTTAEMKDQDTFDPEWDFDNVWYMDDDDYPKLQVFKNVNVFGDKITTTNPNGFGVIGDYTTSNGNPNNASIIPFSPIDETTIVEDDFPTIVVGGVPLSVSLCYATELYSSINKPINYYRVFDVIINNDVENEIENDNLRLNKIGVNHTFISLSDSIRYLNCIEFEDIGIPTKPYVFSGITMATGLYNELLVNKTDYTIDDIDLKDNGEKDILQLAWENNLVSAGKIGDRYFLILEGIR